MKGFGSRWTAFLVLLVLTTQLSGCFTWGNNYSGNKFFPEEVAWKEFRADTVMWLRDGHATVKEVTSKFGTPLMTGSSMEGSYLSYWYQHQKYTKWSYVVGKSEKEEQALYILTVSFDTQGRAKDFHVADANIPGGGKLWTTEEVVKLAIGAAVIYIGGMMAQNMISDAANSAAQQGAAGFQGF